MVRLACVDVPALPLQLLLRHHPDWASLPAVVVDRDTPQGAILWVNEIAWRSRIRPGLRYADALAIEPALRAGAISQATIEEGVDAATRRLQCFSPQVEPSSEFAGVFWLNVAGLTQLYPSLTGWAQAVHTDLASVGLRTSIAVGFSRFGTYATARSSRTITVFEDSYKEGQATLQIPLERLDLDVKLREVLGKLGIKTVGTFLRLPAAGLRQRFGEQAYRLHRLASGELWAPLMPRPAEQPVSQKIILDEAVVNVMHLLAIARRLLSAMLEQLAAKDQALVALHVLFVLDTQENRIETVQPASPTLDAAILLDLLQLRLHGGRLPTGVVELELRAEAAAASHEQLRIFASASHRSLEAGARALARVRAEFGEKAVVHARLREGHLPEAGFFWEPWEPREGLARAHPRRVGVRTLIRRIYTRPRPLPPRPSSERNDNWLMQGLEFGPVERLLGPYIVSGGWWLSTVHREYHFVETRRGDLLWTYYDRKRRRWFLQGKVE